ncbi:MAG: hypothetical protein Q4A60_04600 [Pasteurellaceae bacterium]|nr:hypothetical protein [Pasteurellaceae bacterium]
MQYSLLVAIQKNEEQKVVLALSDEWIAELKVADLMVIYNFNALAQLES